MNLAKRDWLPCVTQTLVERVDTATADTGSAELLEHIHSLAERNRRIHERECFNLNPGTNVMNPKAEALLASGIGSRPSLGYPGDKYEMGLEAIEEIEVIAASLAAELFQARFAEIRAPSGAMANLFGFMALCNPGDTVIVPPATIGGHVTHNTHGCAGLYGLRIVEAPISADGYTVDLDALRARVLAENPRLITLGGSLNLFEHPVAAVREIADLVGAKVLFDAAHQCGLIAGKAWRDPLADGAHLMTMSTYKSLGGPAGGLVVTNDADIAEAVERVAFPGMTANFDAAKSAALAVTLLDWRDFGEAYAAEMVRVAAALAEALDREGVPVFSGPRGFTSSHQFGVIAAPYGGGQAASKLLRRAGFLACGIGLPTTPVDGDLNGLRIGTPELVRWGMGVSDTERVAWLVKAGLLGQDVAAEVADWRCSFSTLHFIHN